MHVYNGRVVQSCIKLFASTNSVGELQLTNKIEL